MHTGDVRLRVLYVDLNQVGQQRWLSWPFSVGGAERHFSYTRSLAERSFGEGPFVKVKRERFTVFDHCGEKVA